MELALVDREAHFRGLPARKNLEGGRERAEIAEVHAGGKGIDERRLHLPADERLVRLRHVPLRAHQRVIEGAVICEEKEPRRVEIEAADRKEVLARVRPHEVDHRLVARVAHRRHDPGGLVHHIVDMRGVIERSPVEGDRLSALKLHARVRSRHAVNRDAARAHGFPDLFSRPGISV